MIVVVGTVGDIPTSTAGVRSSQGDSAAARIAARAAAGGAPVEIVAVVPDDAQGDAALLRLATAGVGHAAVLRGAARPLEAADVDLALRYLPEIRVIVGVGLPPDALAAAGVHAGWSSAALIVVAHPGEPAPGAPDTAIVLQTPARDPDGTFAGFVARLAARLDGGAAPADAWAGTIRDLAVDPLGEPG